jgi:hypothetical protein
MPSRIGQTFNAADFMMMLIVTGGTLAMALAGGLAPKTRKDEPEADADAPETRPEPAAPRQGGLTQFYKTKWGDRG